MSEEQAQPEKKSFKSRFSLFLKIIFFLSAFLLIIFTVMANMGGSSDVLRESIEQFIGESTGYKTKITKLNKMTFFPDISFDFEGTTVGGGEAVSPQASADRVIIRLSFWDVMGNTGKIKKFEIKNFQAAPGTVFVQPLTFENVQIFDKDGEQGKAMLNGQGKIGDQKIEIAAQMQILGKGSSKKYSFGDPRIFNLSIGDIQIATELHNNEDEGVRFDKLSAKKNDKEIFSGYIDFSSQEKGIIDISGILRVGEKTDLSPDLRLDVKQGRKLTGSIKSASFHVEDFNAASGYTEFMKVIDLLYDTHQTTSPEITLDIDNVYSGETIVGSFHGTAPIKNMRLDTDALVQMAQKKP